MVRFTANTVGMDYSDDEFISVGFADELYGEYRDQLYFQRTHEFDEQDVALGMDGVCVERNDQSEGGYGGVERVELHADRIRVRLSGDVAKRTGDGEFEIAFPLTPDEFETLRIGSRAVFAGFDTLIEPPF